MMPKVQFRSKEELREAADRLLADLGGAQGPPVPIELLVEQTFGLDIVPIPGYLDHARVDGALSADLTSITVDQWVMERRQNRYRFTLAHELGHLVLHRPLIESLVMSGTGTWKGAVQSWDAKQYSFLERQANAFAGYLLVPGAALRRHYTSAAERARAHGIALEELGDYAANQVAGFIADAFQVSAKVITIRLSEEGVLPSDR
jgi:hypothetical protein